jgi:hypothetical protein
MEKKLEHYLKISYLELFLGVILVILTTIGVLLFWNASKNAEQVLAERAKLREFVLARAGAASIREFFMTKKTRVLMLASMKEIKILDKEKGPEIVKKFIYDIQDQPISAIGVVDKQGKLVWSENPQKQKVEVGLDLSDRAYFQWAKNQIEGGNVYISQPIISRTGSSKGHWIITMATPLFNNNQFNGAVYISTSIDDLIEKFVTPLTISPQSVSTIITGEGMIIGSTIAGSIGLNLLKDNLDLVTGLEKDQDGSGMMELIYPKNKPTKSIIGYASIKIDEKPWFLLVSIPYKEIKDQLNPSLAIQNQGLALLFIGLIAIILFYVITVRIAERQGFRDGYSNGYDGFKKSENRKN